MKAHPRAGSGSRLPAPAEKRLLILAALAWPAFWLGMLALAWPVSVRVTPHGQAPVIVWAWSALLRWRPALCAGQVAGTLALVWWMLRRSGGLADDARRLTRAFLPLTLLALFCPLLLWRHAVPPRLLANILFHGSVAAVWWPLAHILLPWSDKEPPASSSCRHTLKVAALAAAFFWCTGMAYTRWAGEHAGDEGHYLIQVASLWQDGDLDIRNQYEEMLGEKLPRYLEGDSLSERLHVSPASRGGRWYSYHTPGLPFLAFWTFPLGVRARHLVLALIAGAAAGGIHTLCRLAGAGRRASDLMLGFYMTSLYAVVYASRFLPEMLGAALLSWLMAAIVAQKKHPWPATLAAAALVAALPWAHLRFLPLALLGCGFFGLHGLALREGIRPKLARLGAFALLAGGGLWFYRHWQTRFFAGGCSHDVAGMFMSFPAGILHVFTCHPAFPDVFPLVVWLIPVGLLGAWLARNRRHMLLMPPIFFLATLVLTCSGENWAGGATLPGRFLFVATPLLLPAAARQWMQASRPLRLWISYLACISIGLNVLQLMFLPALGRYFTRPYDRLPLVAPLLWGWHRPWPAAWVLFAAAAVHLALVVADRRSPAASRALLAGLAGLILVAHLEAPGLPSSAPVHRPELVARRLAAYRLSDVGVQAPEEGAPAQLADLSNLLVNRRGVPFQGLRVTTRPMEGTNAGNTISQPLAHDNDWEGRGRRWITLWPPVRAGRGERALVLRGSVKGDAQPVLALREGSRTLLERHLPVASDGTTEAVIRFSTRSRHSLLYILLHLRGEGEMEVADLRLTPASDLLLEVIPLESGASPTCDEEPPPKPPRQSSAVPPGRCTPAASPAAAAVLPPPGASPRETRPRRHGETPRRTAV